MSNYSQLSYQNFLSFCDYAVDNNASDLIITANLPPMIRINGALQPIPNFPALPADSINLIIRSVLPPALYQRFINNWELDFSFSHPKTRFRANVYFQQGKIALALRLIPKKIRTFQELNLPPILERISLASQGFVIVTGPTGHGKSTTLSSMIDYINTNKRSHIITIEDPIEYEFEHKRSIVSQREVGTDTKSFNDALKSCLREDPNVILIGEMRDLESIKSGLTIAETGHLVLTTLHTNNSAQTVDRIIDIFPPEQQQQVRQQLSSVVLAVVSQRLIPKANGKGMAVAMEVMIANSAIRNLIREGKAHQIDNVISTSAEEGMISLDKVLAELVSQGDITLDSALTWSLNPKNLKTMIY